MTQPHEEKKKYFLAIHKISFEVMEFASFSSDMFPLAGDSCRNTATKGGKKERKKSRQSDSAILTALLLFVLGISNNGRAQDTSQPMPCPH